MDKNYGEQLASRESRPGPSRWMMAGGIVLLLILGAGGLFFMLNPNDPEDFYFGLFAIGLGAVFCAALFAAAKMRYAAVTIQKTQ